MELAQGLREPLESVGDNARPGVEDLIERSRIARDKRPRSFGQIEVPAIPAPAASAAASDALVWTAEAEQRVAERIPSFVRPMARLGIEQADGVSEPEDHIASLCEMMAGLIEGVFRQSYASIELRSGREGHPTYRAVAQAMHERIAAVHPGVAAAMSHVDTSAEPRLERIMSEIRTHRKRLAAEREPEPSDAPPGVSALG